MAEGDIEALLALGILDSGPVTLSISSDVDDPGWKL
jgi:hypothetical protein